MIIPIKVTPAEKKALALINTVFVVIFVVLLLCLTLLYAFPKITESPSVGGLFMLVLFFDLASFFICILAKLVMYLKILARKIEKHVGR